MERFSISKEVRFNLSVFNSQNNIALVPHVRDGQVIHVQPLMSGAVPRGFIEHLKLQMEALLGLDLVSFEEQLWGVVEHSIRTFHRAAA